MTEVEEVLEGLEEMHIDDLRSRYAMSVKMIFALSEAIQEVVPESIEIEISRVFRSMIGDYSAK